MMHLSELAVTTYRRGLRCCLSSVALMTPAILTADSTFSNTKFSLTIGNNGKLSSAIRSSDQAELVPAGGSGEGWYLEIPESGALDNLSMTDLGNGRLQLNSVTDPDLIVVLQVTEESRYLKFEIESVSNTGEVGVLDEGSGSYSDWAPYSLGFQMLTSITGGNFHFFPLDYMTSIYDHSTRDDVVWDYLEFSQNGDEPMGAVAVFYAQSDAEYDDILLDIWGNEPSLPIPNRAAQSHWDRAAAEAWLNQWKAAFADTSAMFFFMNGQSEPVGDLYQAVDVAANLGVNTLYLFPDVWRGEYIPYLQSNDGLNTNLFPNGLSDLLALRQYMEDKGVGLDFHYTAGLIGRLDPEYGGPNLHPELATWGSGTLLNSISSGATSLDVSVSDDFKVAELFPWNSYVVPHYYPYIPDASIGVIDIRVGDELLKWQTLDWTSASSFRLAGIDDYGSELTGAGLSHASNEPVTFYYSPWGALVPDPTKPLFTTIAEDYAALLNAADITEVQYDAQNAHYVPWGLWGYDKFAQIIYEKLDHPVTSGDGFGWASWAHMEYNFKQVYQVTRPTQINQAGPIELSQPSVTSTHLDEANFLWAKTVGLNSPYISVTDGLMGVTLNEINGHGQWAEYADSRKLWAAARPYFSEEQRDRMVPELPVVSGVAPLSHLNGDETFRIENGGTDIKVYPTQVMFRPGLDCNWFINQEQGTISPRQFIQPGETLSVSNSYAEQAPEIEIRVLPDMASGRQENINLFPSYSDVSLPSSGSQVVSNSGSAIQIELNNSSSATDYWLAAAIDESAFWRGVHLGSRLIDLQNARGVALTVEGDNSGAELVFTAGYRDYVVTIDFTGTKTIEIPNGEVARFKSGFGFRFNTNKPTNYSTVSAFQLYLGYVPAGVHSNVKVHAIEAMDEDRSIGLVNPVLTLNTDSVTVSGTIPDNCYISYQGGATASVYDADWNFIETLAVSGGGLQADAGLNDFSVSSAASSSIWLETRLKVEDTPWSLPVSVPASLPVAEAPAPAHGSSTNDASIDLSWSATGSSNTIYFGSDYNAVARATETTAEYQGSQAATTFDPGNLIPGTTYYWSVDVSDGSQTTYGPVWSLYVSGPPVFSEEPIDASVAAIGQVYTWSLVDYVSDPDGDSLTYVLVSGPEWLSISPDGILTGTPSSEDVGTYSVTVQVSDEADGYDMVTFTIEVAGPPAWATWNGAGVDNRWDNLTNWQGIQILPAMVSDVWIGREVSNTPVIDSTMIAEAKIIRANNDFAMTGGSLTTANVVILGESSDSPTTFSISGGTATLHSIWVGNNSMGTLQVSGGDVTLTTDQLYVGRFGNGGHVQLDGGRLSVPDLYMPDATTTMDIGAGVLQVSGDKTSAVEALVNDGKITAYAGDGVLDIHYNSDMDTTRVTASIPPVSASWTASGTDNLWGTVANWNTSHLPGLVTDIWISPGYSNPLLIDASVSAKSKIIRACSDINMTGGKLTAANIVILAEAPNSPVTMDISAGTAEVHSIWVGNNSAATLNVSGGSVTLTTDQLYVGRFGNGGHVQLDGGSVSAPGIYLAPSGASVDVTGGTLSLSGDKTGAINAYVSSGSITAYGGSGTVVVTYDGVHTIVTATNP